MGRPGESGNPSDVSSASASGGDTGFSGKAAVGGGLVEHAYRIRVQKKADKKSFAG